MVHSPRRSSIGQLLLTDNYYHKWLLNILEKAWNFDQSAFFILGEAGASKSPLGRSVPMAQVRSNQTRLNSRGTPHNPEHPVYR